MGSDRQSQVSVRIAEFGGNGSVAADWASLGKIVTTYAPLADGRARVKVNVGYGVEQVEDKGSNLQSSQMICSQHGSLNASLASKLHEAHRSLAGVSSTDSDLQIVSTTQSATIHLRVTYRAISRSSPSRRGGTGFSAGAGLSPDGCVPAMP